MSGCVNLHMTDKLFDIIPRTLILNLTPILTPTLTLPTNPTMTCQLRHINITWGACNRSVYGTCFAVDCAEDVSRSRDCEFPRSLRGHWYQAGVGDVIITSSLISTKGECFQQYDEYFLIENR